MVQLGVTDTEKNQDCIHRESSILSWVLMKLCMTGVCGRLEYGGRIPTKKLVNSEYIQETEVSISRSNILAGF